MKWFRKARKTTALLTSHELAEALRLNNRSLIDELYKTAIRTLENEQKREATLDAKTTALLSGSGLAVTVAFTFGGNVLLAHPEYFSDLNSCWIGILLVTYSVALFAGVIAGVNALRAHFVRGDFQAIDERIVFDKDELENADKEGDNSIALYQRYIILHLWQIYQNNFSILDKRALLIAKGQACFLTFILLLMPVGLTMTVSASHRVPDHVNTSVPATQVRHAAPTEKALFPPVTPRGKNMAEDTSPAPAQEDPQRPSSPAPIQDRPPPTAIPPGGTPIHRGYEPPASSPSKPPPTSIPTGGVPSKHG